MLVLLGTLLAFIKFMAKLFVTGCLTVLVIVGILTLALLILMLV